MLEISKYSKLRILKKNSEWISEIWLLAKLTNLKLVILNLKVDKSGKFITGNIISTKQIGRGIPVLDEKQRAMKEIIELTNTDFPENNIIFEQSGRFYPKKK